MHPFTSSDIRLIALAVKIFPGQFVKAELGTRTCAPVLTRADGTIYECWVHHLAKAAGVETPVDFDFDRVLAFVEEQVEGLAIANRLNAKIQDDAQWLEEEHGS